MNFKKTEKNDKIHQNICWSSCWPPASWLAARTSAQILGGLYEKGGHHPEPGMNLVGRVTDGAGPIEGVVVSDGVTVTTTDAQGIYQMRVKRNAPFVFVSVPAEYEIPVENGMPKIYKKIAMATTTRAAQLQARTHGQKRSVSPAGAGRRADRPRRRGDDARRGRCCPC